MTCAMASLGPASPKVGSLAGKKLMTWPHARLQDHILEVSYDSRHSRFCALSSLGHGIGDKARLSKRGDMDFRRPVHRLETAGLAVARDDRFHRMLTQPFIVAGKTHRHVAADIGGDRGDIAACIGEEF